MRAFLCTHIYEARAVSLRTDTRFGNRKMESPDMLHEQLDGQLKLVRLDPLQGKEFCKRSRIRL